MEEENQKINTETILKHLVQWGSFFIIVKINGKWWKYYIWEYYLL